MMPVGGLAPDVFSEHLNDHKADHDAEADQQKIAALLKGEGTIVCYKAVHHII